MARFQPPAAPARKGLPALRAQAIVTAISLVGIVVGSQGWRARIPNLDTVPSITGAADFVRTGSPPARGVVSSFLSYVPPGASWVAVPGVLIFADPRLAMFPGAAALYIGTLAGVWALARRYFDARCALLAVIVYGLSEAGIQYATFIGPRGHPFFFVWMIYLACEWERRGDGRFLAASVAVWGTGMYLFLELAPALVALPALWFRRRPPVGWRSLTLGLVSLALLWLPYLRFERARDFVDLRSQVLRQSLLTDAPPVPFCDQRLMLAAVGSWPGGAEASDPAWRVLEAAGRRVLSISRGLTANLHTALPGGDVVVLGLLLAGFAIFWGPSNRPPALAWLSAGWASSAVAVLLAGGVVVNQVVIARLVRPGGALTEYSVGSIRVTQILLTAAGLALLLRAPIAHVFNRLVPSQQSRTTNARAVLLCLAVPWAVCLAVVEHGRHERLSFLWPVQAVVLAACLTASFAGPGWIRRAWACVRMVLVAALIASPIWGAAVSTGRVGWSGIDAPEVVLVSRAAERIRASRRAPSVAIGYHVFPAQTWGSRFAQTDSRYKFGAEFDLLFDRLFGITNTNRCPEGLSAADDYRILEAPPSTGEVREYVDLPLDSSFQPVSALDRYRLFERP